MTISIKNLSLNFQNKKILKNVSFEIKKNTLTSLLGPNGSGKSSILKCITGEIDTYSGKITNIPIEKIAYLPQELETPPFITVKELVSLGFYNRKISKIKVVLFFNFASGRTLPTQSTGPQPIQLVPKHRFLQISLYRSLKSQKFKKQGGFNFKICLSLGFSYGLITAVICGNWTFCVAQRK